MTDTTDPDFDFPTPKQFVREIASSAAEEAFLAAGGEVVGGSLNVNHEAVGYYTEDGFVLTELGRQRAKEAVEAKPEKKKR